MKAYEEFCRCNGQCVVLWTDTILLRSTRNLFIYWQFLWLDKEVHWVVLGEKWKP